MPYCVRCEQDFGKDYDKIRAHLESGGGWSAGYSFSTMLRNISDSSFGAYACGPFVLSPPRKVVDTRCAEAQPSCVGLLGWPNSGGQTPGRNEAFVVRKQRLRFVGLLYWRHHRQCKQGSLPVAVKWYEGGRQPHHETAYHS